MGICLINIKWSLTNSNYNFLFYAKLLNIFLSAYRNAYIFFRWFSAGLDCHDSQKGFFSDYSQKGTFLFYEKGCYGHLTLKKLWIICCMNNEFQERLINRLIYHTLLIFKLKGMRNGNRKLKLASVFVTQIFV